MTPAPHKLDPCLWGAGVMIIIYCADSVQLCTPLPVPVLCLFSDLVVARDKQSHYQRSCDDVEVV